MMMHGLHAEQLQDIRDDLPRFVEKLQALALQLGLDLSALEADHISLRCHQNMTAERWKTGLSLCGQLISEKHINGRPVCLFRMASPLTVGPWHIPVIELPWPGEKRYPHEGWEHVEIVLRGAPENLAARAVALLSDAGLSTPGISVKTSAPAGEQERLPNPTFAITNGQITIKFHPYSIEEIAASEAAGSL